VPAVALAVAAAALVVAVVLAQAVLPLRAVVVVTVASAVLVGTLARDTGVRLALLLVPLLGLVRRITAGPAAYVPADPLVLLPYLLVVPALLPLLAGGPRRERTPGALALGLLLVWALLCAAVGAARAPTLVLPGALFQLGPLALGCLVALGGHPRLPRAVLTSLAVLGPLAAAYALLQYLAPPRWDLAWLTTQQEELLSVGRPVPGEFRVWGPTEAPAALALYLGASLCVLLAGLVVAERARRRAVVVAALVAGAACAAALVLTSVRSVLFVLPLAVLVPALLLPAVPARRRLRAAGAVAAGGVLLLPVLVGGLQVSRSVLDPSAREPADRLSLGALGDDRSLAERAALLGRFSDAVARPLGLGPGGSFEGAQSVDNGYLAVALELGAVGLALFLLTLGLAVRAAVARLRAPGGPARWELAAALVVLLGVGVQVGAPVLQGSFGILFWPLVGALLRGADAEADADEPGASAAPVLAQGAEEQG
jgi:hypothetical protein